MNDKEINRRVAEIMGFVFADGCIREANDDVWSLLPEYLTFADDDYTVLEWARENLTEDEMFLLGIELHKLWSEVGRMGSYWPSSRYLPGDYSRALIAVKGER